MTAKRFLLGIVVAAVGVCRAAESPSELLARARVRILGELHEIPNFTCVQTLTRFYFQERSPLFRRHTCAEITQAGSVPERSPFKLAWEDRLRFDIAVAGGKEIFSWAGENRFRAEENWELAGEGAIGTGDFGGFLSGIFGVEGPIFEYLGERSNGNERILEFRYQIPADKSTYRYHGEKGRAQVSMAFSGTFWLDSKTADLKRLTLDVEAPPAETKMCRIDSVVSYHNVELGVHSFLVPENSEMIVFDYEDGKSENHATYGRCREYAGESKIHFEEFSPEIEKQAEAHVLKAIPSEFVDIRLESPIDPAAMYAGSRVRGLLAESLRTKSGKVIAQKGMPAEGRIVRIQQRHRPVEGLVVGLRFDSLSIGGVKVPVAFRPAFEPGGAARGSPPLESGYAAPDFSTPRDPLAGFFVFPGEHRIVPAGFLSHWRTEAQSVPAGLAP